MPEIGAYEAKTKLSELLKRVSKGERFVITKHGIPVAVLEPLHGKKEAKEIIEEIKKFRKGHRLKGIPLKHLIEEGRR